MSNNSLWGDDFVVDDTKSKSKALLNKVNNPKKVKTEKEVSIKSKKLTLDEKLEIIRENVEKFLGVYKDVTIIIKSKEELKEYIDKSISNGIIAIDTETNNSLDPLTCKIMGACIYTPGMKNAYVPMNHVDKDSRDRFDWQVTEEELKEQFDRLQDTKILMHNGKFDYKVIKCTCDCELDIFWDSLVGAKVLDENEISAGLKQQYIDKIDPSIEKYSIDKLFDEIEYAVVDPELFALYAATDAFMTYKLYEYQSKELTKPGNERLYSLFKDVEMPLVKIIADMEVNGVAIDLEYGKRLSKKFHNTLDELTRQLNEELNSLTPQINKWRLTEDANQITETPSDRVNNKTKSEQLPDEININSTVQLAILLYDVLKVPPYNKKSPRSTSEDALKKIEKESNITLVDTILKIRGVEKLLGTYIDKIPTILSPRDGRLHGEFLQFGADTGRFSSKNPNLQNIPARGDNSVRRMFVATEGYTFVGSDYSQQEPRLLSHYSGDENMIDAYRNNKDLYAMIASKVYHNNYEDNKEFYPDGSMNIEGKHRRQSCKSLLLGIMYGMGDAMTAQRIGCSLEEAKKIREDFFIEFPKVKKWIDETQSFAHKYGYVEDVWGRRRRLPDIMLPKYEITSELERSGFNPLLNSSGKYTISDTSKIGLYREKLSKAKYKKDVDAIKEEAKKNGVSIKDNSGFIATAERQSVNARVQGGSATMSKRAIVSLGSNPELKQLGFRPLILVHDEIIGECPIENKERVMEILSQTMVNAAKPEVVTPMRCDADAFVNWYDDVYGADIRTEYKKLIESGNNDSEAFNTICNNHIECTEEELRDFVNGVK